MRSLPQLRTGMIPVWTKRVVLWPRVYHASPPALRGCTSSYVKDTMNGMGSENSEYLSELRRLGNHIHTTFKAALRGLRIRPHVRLPIPSQLKYYAKTPLVHIGPDILLKMALERGAQSPPSIGEHS